MCFKTYNYTIIFTHYYSLFTYLLFLHCSNNICNTDCLKVSLVCVSR